MEFNLKKMCDLLRRKFCKSLEIYIIIDMLQLRTEIRQN